MSNDKDMLDKLVEEHNDANKKLQDAKELYLSSEEECSPASDLIERIDKTIESAKITPQSNKQYEEKHRIIMDKAGSIAEEIERSTKCNPELKDINEAHLSKSDNDLELCVKQEKLDIILADENTTSKDRIELENLKYELNQLQSKTNDYNNYKIKCKEQELAVKESFEKIDKYAKDNDMTNPLIPDSSKSDTSIYKIDESKASTLTSDSKRRSLVEDFANPNTEMPSYIDPED